MSTSSHTYRHAHLDPLHQLLLVDGVEEGGASLHNHAAGLQQRAVKPALEVNIREGWQGAEREGVCRIRLQGNSGNAGSLRLHLTPHPRQHPHVFAPYASY